MMTKLPTQCVLGLNRFPYLRLSYSYVLDKTAVGALLFLLTVYKLMILSNCLKKT